MKTILFAPYNLLAHYLRSIQLARSLKEYPLDIRFLSSDKYNGFVTDNGFNVCGTPVLHYENVVSRAARFDFGWINRKSAAHTVEQFIRLIGEIQPDLIVGDTFLGLHIAAQYHGIPQVSLINAYVTNYYPLLRDVPHHHRALKFKKFLTSDQWERIVRTVEEITLKRLHAPYRAIRKKYGLQSGQNLFDEFTGDYNLICDDPDIFPLSDPPEHFITGGPILYQCTRHEEEVLEFIARQDNRPVIFISSGSSGRHIVPEILHETDLKEYTLIVAGFPRNTTGKNAIYRQFVNFGAVAEYTDLVICHAGNGTMYQALHAGKRIIAVPVIFEQEWNASRFAGLGLCRVFYPDQPASELLTMVEQILLTEPNQSYRGKYSDVPASFRNLLRKLL